MGKSGKAAKRRSGINDVLDEVLESGKPVEIERHGQILIIIPKTGRRLDLTHLPRRKALRCSPDDLVNTSWEGEWLQDG